MTEDRLAQALTGWAAANRPTERERERMRTTILLTPEVDARWWDQFDRQMARIATRAAGPRGTEPPAWRWATPLA